MIERLEKAPGSCACVLLLFLAACGDHGQPMLTAAGPPSISQFTSDRVSYFVGERAQLTAVFENGIGSIQPGGVAIASGQTITTPPLSASTTFRLTVVANAGIAIRDLALTASYRERMRAIAMPFARGMHAAVPLNDGRVLIVGGVDESGLVTRSMYSFDPSSETFTQLAGTLDSGRVGFTAASLADGSVLVIGRLVAIPDAVVVDPQTGAVAPTASPPQIPRLFATATRLQDGKVLIVGGIFDSTPERSAEIYDPATGRFTLLPASLSFARYQHTAVAFNDGRVLIYGGITGTGTSAPPELYDPATGTFTTLTPAESTVRADHDAVRTSDGNIWIVGGGEDQAASALTSVIRFDATTLGLSRALDLATPRTFVAAAPLTDSRVLVTGGVTANFGDIADSSELIVTATALRTAGPSMSRPRYQHTMTVLTNGKVLIVGGIERPPNTNPAGVASAEIFE